MHQHKNADDADRNDDARHHGCARITQKEIQDEYRQQAAVNGCIAHFAHRARNEFGLVVHAANFRAGRQAFAQLVEPRTDGMRELHGVGVALLVYGQLDAFAAVEARNSGSFLVTAHHPGHIFQIDRAIIDGCDDGAIHFLERFEFVDGAHEESLRALLKPSAGQIDVFVAQALGDVAYIEFQLGKSLLIDVDLNFILEAAADLDGGRSLNGLDFRLDPIVGKATQVFEPIFAGDVSGGGGDIDKCNAQYRLGGWIEAQQQRPRRFQRQLQQIQAFAHLDAGKVHVGAPGKFQNHVGLARSGH